MSTNCLDRSTEAWSVAQRGKSAVVTGASRGIGRAIALRLADEGAGVAICARGEPALRDAEAELRRRSVPVYAAVCDVGNADALDGFLRAARESLGSVDILVNNPSGFVFSNDLSVWDSTLNVDLMAAVRATATVAPWMGNTGGGAIIHISSIAGLEAAGFPASYGAAKAGLVSHGKSLAVALAPQKFASIQSRPVQSNSPAACGNKQSTTTRNFTVQCSRPSLRDEWVPRRKSRTSSPSSHPSVPAG